MPTSKLTRRSVEAFEPALDRQIFLWDTEIRGFGVRALPSGLKTFIIQYRNASGAKHRINLGRYGLMTVEQARDLARIKLGAVAAGDDPAEALHRDRNGMTVGQVCDWYLEEAEAERLLGRRHKPIAKSTLALDRSRIEQHVRPLLGNRSIQKLTIADLERFQADVKEGKTSKDRKGRGGVATGGAGVAGRTIGMLHTIFEQAARWRIIEGNPARGVRKISVDVKRDRRLSVDELKRFTTALEEHKATSPVAVAAINLILLSGFRRMEALGLKWDWVDRGGSCVRFPDTKTGPQVRPIGSAALTLIAAQPKRKGCAYVFPGDFSDGHFVGMPRVLQRICVTAGIEGVTPHTLRHTFASMAGELGFSELTICALLGHAPRGVTQRYIHIDDATKLAANQVSKAIEVMTGCA
ncbi:MAG: site-specific integrase [Sphingobium sp.]|jgi:integrase|nr:site-specific integrase [Sphingobium sp.]MCI1270721.1 site-specific integrase [Sphingobium sp.]MCI1755150.1 site-specific integrase [Sphingobium sp.]MCI2053461.1 site-specific integrase [Sphingobium sp.]